MLKDKNKAIVMALELARNIPLAFFSHKSIYNHFLEMHHGDKYTNEPLRLRRKISVITMIAEGTR